MRTRRSNGYLTYSEPVFAARPGPDPLVEQVAQGLARGSEARAREDAEAIRRVVRKAKGPAGG
jgi:hypothetical protein